MRRTNTGSINFKVGLENEFTTSRIVTDDIEREFYNKQYEDNKNLISIECQKRQLKTCLKKSIIKLHNQSITKILQSKLTDMIFNLKRKGVIYFSPNVVSIMNNSIVFNGIHLTIDKTPLYEHIYELSESQLKYLNASIPFNSWRKLMSHHVFGKYRNSIYSFKSREKFIPINLKEKYIEFRFIESLDFINPLKLEELVKYLTNLSKNSYVERIINSRKYRNRFHLLRRFPNDFLELNNDITTIENQYIIKTLKVFKAGYINSYSLFYTKIQNHILRKLLEKRRIHLKIFSLHIRNENLQFIYEKIKEKNITLLYHKGLYRRISKSKKSPITKLLLYPSLKLIKVSNTFIPIQEFPSVRIIMNGINNFVIQFRITLEILPFRFNKNTLSNFININSDLVDIYQDFEL